MGRTYRRNEYDDSEFFTRKKKSKKEHRKRLNRHAIDDKPVVDESDIAMYNTNSYDKIKYS